MDQNAFEISWRCEDSAIEQDQAARNRGRGVVRAERAFQLDSDWEAAERGKHFTGQAGDLSYCFGFVAVKKSGRRITGARRLVISSKVSVKCFCLSSWMIASWTFDSG
jgi:hypothetical protein